MNKERLKGHLDPPPLSVLAAGPAHGYAIITSLRARSDGTFDLPEGTAYPAGTVFASGVQVVLGWQA
jgi:PadR family transcriptional regulator, regulatory protein PadR